MDAEDNLIDSRRKIVVNYLSGWFVLDLIGVFPFDTIIQSSTENNTSENRYGNLARVARLPRIYRLIRLSRILRLLKIIKERN